MSINLKAPQLKELKPHIVVCGVGGAGGNAVNNMIASGLSGVDFIVANTDAQALASSRAERIIQMGLRVTEGLGAGARPEVGRAAAEEAMEEICDHLAGSHMVFLTAGMGGGTGTGAAPVIARAAREMGIVTVGVVTKPFHFESGRRMKVAEAGIAEMQKAVDTLIIIPNQNLFRIANAKTTVADAFAMADEVLCSGVACITDLMVKEGLVNLDFADVCSIISEMGTGIIGVGEASGERRALRAAEAAIANPLLHETSIKSARGVLISITGNALTLFDVDEAAGRIRQEVDDDANIIVGAMVEPALHDVVRVSVVATGIDQTANLPIASVSVRPQTGPDLHPLTSELVECARAEPVVPEAPAPVAGRNVETQSSAAPVIPFPEPTSRSNPLWRRSFLERLGVTAPEAHNPPRASGWW
jgi:cell division protein FtsZ